MSVAYLYQNKDFLMFFADYPDVTSKKYLVFYHATIDKTPCFYFWTEIIVIAVSLFL